MHWGTTNASAGILLGLAQGRLYAVDEWWLDGSQMHIKPTVGQQADALIAFAQASQPRPEWVVVDPAAAAFQTELFHRGITARHADNEVLRGLGLLATLLGSGHLLVSERCKALIREMPSYSWAAGGVDYVPGTPQAAAWAEEISNESRDSHESQPKTEVA